MEDATRDHFFRHGPSQKQTPALLREKDDCQWCQLRRFPTAKTYPVTIVNDVDDATLPPSFRFLADSVPREGVQVAEDSFRSGCDCPDDESCQYSKCLCLQDHEEAVAENSRQADDEEEEDGIPGGDYPHKKVYFYHTQGAKAGLLRSKFLDQRLPIYECHDACACSSACPNRVVGRGRKVPLQIFRTEKTGWGVRSQSDIKRGQFVDRYIGEIITPDEAERRRNASQVASRKDIYLFALDKFTDAESLDPRLKVKLEIDGEFMSGPTRFINHSCDPNLRIFARVGDHADKHIHDIAFFAIKDIPRGEELTFDYTDGVPRERSGTSAPGTKDVNQCLCGSSECRGYLF